MRPTDEQRAALDMFLKGDTMVVDAGAGCGKTSTLRLFASATLKRGRYLVFSKDLADEVSGTMPDRCYSSTAHSMAYKQYGYDYAHRLRAPRMKGSDLATILGLRYHTVITPFGPKDLTPGWQAGHVMRALETFYQTTDQQPSWVHFPYVEGLDLAADKRAGLPPNNVELAKHLEGTLGKAWVDIQQTDGNLRFTHGAYLKMYYLTEPKIPADYILFDEAQDANPVLAALIEAQTHAQRVYVGDQNQAIFRFTGAIDAMATFDAAQRAELSQTFRFGDLIADEANEILDQLDSPMMIIGNPSMDSTVSRLRSDEAPTPDALLCRTNAGALRAAITWMLRDVPVHLVGGKRTIGDFAEGAKELIDDGRTSYWELQCFNSWSDVVAYVKDDPQGSDLALMVKLIEEFTVDRVLQTIADTKPDQPGVLAISTAHKAKGREWDSVAIAADMGAMADTEDELRLRYVAFTRARRHLDLSRFESGLAERLGRARR